MAIRITEVLNYFKEPWQLEWQQRKIAKAFKKMKDIDKSTKFALSLIKKACDDGADIGSRVDELVKSGSLIPSKKDSLEINSCINAFIKWKQIYNPTSIEPCKRTTIQLEGQEITGEPDLIVDGVLVDIKCAKKISPKYWIQVNMYRYLRGEHGKVAILRLDKETASYEYVVKEYDPFLVSVWRGLLNAYVYLKGDSDGGPDFQEGISE